MGKRKLGVTFSCFDLLHAGHVQMLREAKTVCDYLLVGLQVEPQVERPDKHKPVQTLVERYTQLKAVSYVDEIIPYQTEDDLIDILGLYMPDVRIIGEDYRWKDFTGKAFCTQRNIEIYYNSREHTFSTTKLRSKVCESN